MKTYPYGYELPLHYVYIQVFDGHPITGSREYERAYYTSYNVQDVSRYTIFAMMKHKGWELCRTERYAFGGISWTWCRKK
jgi:hypothetical protein